MEDVDTSQEDHNYDEFRYMAMYRSIEPRINVQPDDVEWTPPPEDPLDMMDTGYITDPYDIVRKVRL